MAINFIEPNKDGSQLRIGIVSSRFNEWACEDTMDACLNQLKKLGVKEENIYVTTVPGSLEIPFALSELLNAYELDAMVAIGCIIRGETYHFELVANESARAISELVAQANVPIANCILTVENEEQAKARTLEKGTDAANVAVEMGNLYYLMLDKNKGSVGGEGE